MTDVNILAWIMRLQQTEALIEKRKGEVHAHQQRRFELASSLQAEEALTAKALHDLSGLREQSEALTQRNIQLQQEIEASRSSLASAQALGRLAAHQQALQGQLERLHLRVTGEARVRQQYESSVASFMEQQGGRAQELKHTADQISSKLQRLQQQEHKLQIGRQIDTLNQQQGRLQAKLQQLTATLTDSKQANACTRGNVDAAADSTAAQLLSAKERLAAVKRQTFQLTRQASVNEARLHQLDQESNTCKQQCSNLESLISQAAMTIDQLASSCDL